MTRNHSNPGSKSSYFFVAHSGNSGTPGTRPFSAEIHSGYILAIGGWVCVSTNLSYFNTVDAIAIQEDASVEVAWIRETPTEAWTAAPGSFTSRSDHSSTIYDGYLYLIGGVYQLTLSDFLNYRSDVLRTPLY